MIESRVKQSTVYAFKILRDLLSKSKIDAQVQVTNKSFTGLTKIVSVRDVNTNRLIIKKEIDPDYNGYNFPELEFKMIADLMRYGVGAIWYEEEKRLQVPFAELKSGGKHEVVRDEPTDYDFADEMLSRIEQAKMDQAKLKQIELDRENMAKERTVLVIPRDPVLEGLAQGQVQIQTMPLSNYLKIIEDQEKEKEAKKHKEREPFWEK